MHICVCMCVCVGGLGSLFLALLLRVCLWLFCGEWGEVGGVEGRKTGVGKNTPCRSLDQGSGRTFLENLKFRVF